ncbi:MAG: DUF2752 domain-containing protein [Phycisphaerae bacterium]
MNQVPDIGASEALPPFAKVVDGRNDGHTLDSDDMNPVGSDEVHPLGPWIEPVVCAAPARGRFIAGVVAAVGLALVGVAAYLTPDPAGMGTHQQLGLPPCTSVVITGYPCPTCGMTTAFSLTVRGRLLSAFHAQPAGLLFALATMLVTAVALVSAVSGRFWTPNFYRISWPRWAIGFVVLLLGGWGYKLVVGIAAGTLPIGG